MGYSGLIYKTKGNSNPQGKSKVYFCATPDDYRCHFESITKDIFTYHRNCSIWYFENPDVVVEDDEMELFEADLREMQLFVVVVSSEFLHSSNRAREIAFKFAIDNNIPVLPIIVEQGLESDFNNLCANLQCLNKVDKDPTAIPYEEKLKTFLEEVLVSDELANKVREAFDAYIFLSYRKKDRAYAQKIMHLIHESEFCRDIAIWYDEFLVPGEDFNDAIKDAFDKSGLFVLAVTPNLLEKPNYVMSVEYPMALQNKKNVLPIEMVDTDSAKLNECYQGIPDCVRPDASFEEKLKSFVNSSLELKVNNNPVHLFFMGLAYLSGIDVEVNSKKAIELFTKSAEGGCYEAYERLVSIYENGIGVPVDVAAAMNWQCKYVDCLRAAYDNQMEKNQNTAIKVFRALHKYNRMFSYSEDYKKSLEVCALLIEYAKKIGDKHFMRVAEVIYGHDELKCRNYDVALEHYKKALNIAIEICRENPSNANLIDVADCSNRIGHLYSSLEKSKKAADFYSKYYEIMERLFDEKGILEDSIERFSVLQTKANVAIEKNHFDDARKYGNTLLSIALQNREVANDTESLGLLYDVYSILEKVEVSSENYEDAIKFCRKRIETAEEIYAKTQTNFSKLQLETAYDSLGVCLLGAKNQSDYGEALLWFSKAQKILDDILVNQESADTRRSLAYLYDHFGSAYRLLLKTDDSFKYYEKSLDLKLKLFDEFKDPLSKYDLQIAYWNIAVLCNSCGKTSEAVDYQKKCLKIAEEMVEETDIYRNVGLLIRHYVNLYDYQIDDNQIEAAIETFFDFINRLESSFAAVESINVSSEVLYPFKKIRHTPEGKRAYQNCRKVLMEHYYRYCVNYMDGTDLEEKETSSIEKFRKLASDVALYFFDVRDYERAREICKMWTESAFELSDRDTTIANRFESYNAYFELGEIELQLGRNYDASKTALNIARNIVTKLYEETNENEYLFQLALCNSQLFMAEVEDINLKRAYMELSVAQYSELVEKDPKINNKINLAISASNLAAASDTRDEKVKYYSLAMRTFKSIDEDKMPVEVKGIMMNCSAKLKRLIVSW